MATATAINDKTGKWETVNVDGMGRVPPGYRAPSGREMWRSRVAKLREDAAEMEARGDVVGASQARRTLADMGAD